MVSALILDDRGGRLTRLGTSSHRSQWCLESRAETDLVSQFLHTEDFGKFPYHAEHHNRIFTHLNRTPHLALCLRFALYTCLPPHVEKGDMNTDVFGVEPMFGCGHCHLPGTGMDGPLWHRKGKISKKGNGWQYIDWGSWGDLRLYCAARWSSLFFFLPMLLNRLLAIHWALRCP